MPNVGLTRAAKRRPIQVYLEESEAALLTRAAKASGTSKSEVVRQAVRRLARELVAPEADPAWQLVGAAGEDATLPEDLAARHDRYLTEWERRGERSTTQA